MIEWFPIATVPLEVPVVARTLVHTIPGAKFWVGTVVFHEDAGHWTDGATVLHYNNNVLVAGFRGQFTEWTHAH